MNRNRFLVFFIICCMTLTLTYIPGLSFASDAATGTITGYIAPDFSSASMPKSAFKVDISGLTANTNAQGYFELKNIPASSYTIKISKQGYLQREIKNVVVKGNDNVQIGSQSSPVLMWIGDFGAQDGVVNISDVIMFAKYFGGVFGSSNYDEIYDLNKDNSINMSDVLIIAKYFGKSSNDYPEVDIVYSSPDPQTTPTPTASVSPIGQPDFSLIGFASLEGGTTGGAGGSEVTASSAAELTTIMSQKKKDTTPLIIKITGKITGSGAIAVKSVKNLSIIGVGDKAELEGVGLNIQSSSNVIVRNLKIHHTLAPTDCIGIDTSDHVWVDHCELFNMIGDCNGDGKIDTEGDISGGDVDWYDGLLDCKNNSAYITVSWNYFHDSFKTSLIGSSDSDNYDRKMTYHHNIFQNCDERQPSYRFGTGHLFNNYYVDIWGSSINSRMGAKLKIENNCFENVGSGEIEPVLGFAEGPIGAYYSKEKGFWDVKDNKYVNCKGNQPTESTCSFTPPYDYSKAIDPVDNVKALVTKYAGVGKIDVSAPSQTPSTIVPTSTPTATIKPSSTITPTATVTATPTIINNTPSATIPGNAVKDYDSLMAAISAAKPGDTVLIGASIRMKTRILLDKSGVTLAAAPGITPVLDFDDLPLMTETFDSCGIVIDGDNYTINGLIVEKAGKQGIVVHGSGNTIKNCISRYNEDTGIQVSGTTGSTGPKFMPKNNTVINCYSYRNCDTLREGGNADCFACKKTDPGPNNNFIDCAGWESSDDGWDYFDNQNDSTLTNCMTWNNGDDTVIPFEGNGNGFKLGSSGCTGPRTLKNCIAFDIQHGSAKAFDENNGFGTGILTDCIAFNSSKDYKLTGKTMTNCLGNTNTPANVQSEIRQKAQEIVATCNANKIPDPVRFSFFKY
ncbi:MAG: dockerin type I domain-containing protein [Bacillota bacterium]|nr:dockerin type I domain-containing protein [Bacillota bacterium]